MWGSNCTISMRRRQQEGANFSGTRTMLRFHLKSLLWLAQKGPLYGLVVLVILGSTANAMHRCSRTRQGPLLVTNCQGQGHVAVPDADPSSQAFLLNFNRLSLIQNSSFPVMRSLQILSLGGQLKGSLFVGERAFQNVSTNLTFLDLGGNKNLTFHPRAFMGLGKLEVLLLDTNGLDEAVLEGGFFRDLVSLKRLDLSGNSIGRVRPDPTFLALKRLSVLQLKLNRIEAICGHDLQNLWGRHLSLLDLSANRLRNRHRCANPFRNITLGTLDISSNSLNAEEAEKFFAVLNGTRIRQLKMQRSAALGKGYGFRNLKDISAFTFSGLCSSGVVALDMSYGFLNQLPPSAFLLLPDLYALLLRSNQISRIRKGAFAGLKHLRILDLSHNLLGELRRESLKALRASPLQQLILKSNHIGVIQHDALAGLDALEMLDLADNALSRIPSGKLPALLYLKLRGNRFRDAWGLEKLGKKLIYLDFSSNYLSDVGKIWAPVGGIPTLNFLNLSHNQLESCFKVPPGPRQLRYLDLAHNRLGKIWERGSCVTLLQPLGELVFLNLSFNLLQTLPKGLFQGLVALQILDLSSNHLSMLAEEAFLGLKSLRNLSLEGNPLKTLSPSVFSPLEELRSLNLMGLALSCHCGLAPLQTWMRDKERTVSGLVFTVSCTQTAPSFQKVSLARFLHEKCGQEHADTLKTY